MNVIEIKNLKKFFNSNFLFRQIQVLKGINITVEKGETYGFLGPNGAGKTTTIKCMLDIIFPNSGEIKIFEQPHHRKNIRHKIGFLPENPCFYEYLTAQELLLFTGSLFSLPAKDMKKKATGLIELVGLKGKENLKLKKYSKGMIQRIGLAQVLINNPDLIILDEPFSGLDPIGRKELRDIILSLKDAGKTIFFSSHILQDIELIVDKVGIIFNGVMIKEGKLSDLITHSTKSYEIVITNLAKEKLQSQNWPYFLQDKQYIIQAKNLKIANKILDYISKNGGQIHSINPAKMTLEEIFLKEIKG